MRKAQLNLAGSMYLYFRWRREYFYRNSRVNADVEAYTLRRDGKVGEHNEDIELISSDL